MIHYYFKFGKGNEKFKEFLNNENELKEPEKPIPLSIYFGKWKAEDITKVIDDPEQYPEISKSPKGRTRNQNQIKKFSDVKKSPNETYFWIFYKDKVFCLRPIDGEIHDGPNELIYENGSLPKSIVAKLILKKEKKDLPEVFANTGSNRTYNSPTISKLGGKQKEIAEFLIEKKNYKNKSPILITKNNFLFYLSPIEFETLIFLIFNYSDSYCSSFRGGTMEGFDLKVRLSINNPYELPDGVHWIQVKKKGDNDTETQTPLSNGFLIHNGEREVPNKIFGRKWLTNVIDKREDIKDWLKNMTFNYPEIFNFDWDSKS